MNNDDLELYLPKFLSDDSQYALKHAIEKFPSIESKEFYSDRNIASNLIYQGDGIKDLILINLPKTDIKKKEGIILSNTCDIDPSNKQLFQGRLIYAPIFSFQNYLKILLEEGQSKQKVDDHSKSIKNQQKSQIFYLPEYKDVMDESIVFLDRVFNLPNNYINRKNLKYQRIFSLSDFGNYLFVFKLSIHFTRIQDGIDRGSN